MKLAKVVFTAAGAYGLIVLAPMYFVIDHIAVENPPAVTHPIYFYGFVGIALAWQLVFLQIARQPGKLRLLMIPAMLEKLAFGVPAVLLYVQDRLSAKEFAFGLIDLTLLVLFVVAFDKTAPDVAIMPPAARDANSDAAQHRQDAYSSA